MNKTGRVSAATSSGSAFAGSVLVNLIGSVRLPMISL